MSYLYLGAILTRSSLTTSVGVSIGLTGYLLMTVAIYGDDRMVQERNQKRWQGEDSWGKSECDTSGIKMCHAMSLAKIISDFSFVISLLLGWVLLQ